MVLRLLRRSYYARCSSVF